MAQALFGKKVGELITVNGREWEIVDLIAEA
jgi:transcription elongation GreA/GreB family factor